MKPTTHLPGTLAKIREMSRRARARRPLFQPNDAAIPDTDGPKRLKGVYQGRGHHLPHVLDVNYRKYLNIWDQQLHQQTTNKR